MQAHGYYGQTNRGGNQIEYDNQDKFPVHRALSLPVVLAGGTITVQIEPAIGAQLCSDDVPAFLFMAYSEPLVFEGEGTERKLLPIHACRAFRYTLGQQAENAFCPLG